ncbi:MAG: hypothetical protein IT303_01490 [Dehalococcoidia bacterium]|nr:hypothetical protein [Dehalococcoidia bacterium]
MFAAWTAEARDGQSLERLIEAHLNEFAETVVSVSYHVSESGVHRALAVYIEIEAELDDDFVAAAELAILQESPR